jgi:hypothetical protein
MTTSKGGIRFWHKVLAALLVVGVVPTSPLNNVGEAPKSLSTVAVWPGISQLSTFVAPCRRTMEYESPRTEPTVALPVATQVEEPEAAGVDQMGPPSSPAGTAQ